MPPGAKLMIFGRPSLLWEGAPSPEEYYQALGYGEVHTLDVSDYEGATFIHDLNSERIPDGLEGQYDEINFGGTAEHIFNVGNVLRTAARLVKVGGVVACSAPANNWLDHGFYQICPTLKFDFFNQNDFELGFSEATIYLPGQSELLRVVPLFPGEAQRLNFIPARISHVLNAMRTSVSTWDRIPLQSIYQRKHAGYRPSWRFSASEPRDVIAGDVRIAPDASTDDRPEDDTRQGWTLGHDLPRPRCAAFLARQTV